MNFQRRILVAVALCAMILVIYDLMFPPPPKPEGDAKADEAKVEAKAEAEPEVVEAAAAEAEAVAPAFPITSHRIATDKLALDVTNRAPAGGLIEGVHLLDGQFLDSESADDAFGLGGQRTLAVSFADAESDFKVPRQSEFEVRDAAPNYVELGWKSAEVEIIERVEMHAGYEARLHVTLTNRSGRPQNHRLHVSTRVGAANSNQYNVAHGLCHTVDDIESEDRDDLEDGPIEYGTGILWAGVDTKYFAQLVVPEHQVATCVITDDAATKSIEDRISTAMGELAADGSVTYTFGLYMGPKTLEGLQKFSAVQAGGVDLSEAIDWGYLGALGDYLGELLLRLMRFFYGIVGSWGVAIVLLTITVKLATLPLTLKQMRSMKRMKEIQPEMAKIKEKYAEDRVKQGQEMQALFARSGVNPLAGCLPILAQMPIWIALYWMLGAAVELVHVPFLWLPDLTKQDPFYILPLSWGAMMFLQNRMMPSMGDEAQARMMKWIMPIMFTGLMLFLPSGLGVYMFANTLLSIVQTAVQVGTGAKKKAEAAANTGGKDA